MGIEEVLDANEQLIVSGQGLKVRGNLADLLSLKKIDRRYVGRIGNQCRRVGMASKTLKLLYKIVYPDSQIQAPPTNFERLQYAAALIATGASSEPLKILQNTSSVDEPEVLLYQAIAHFTKWEYLEAIPFLEEFIDSPKVNEYQKMMGRINLCSALLMTRNYSSAHNNIDQVIRMTAQQNLKLLNSYALELKAELFIWDLKVKESRLFLHQASQILNKTGALSSLWGKKWKAIGLFIDGNKGAGIRSLSSVRIAAQQSHDWETVRECDLFKSIFFLDKDLFNQVYFGTPFRAYKRRAINFALLVGVDTNQLLEKKVELLRGSKRSRGFDLNTLKVEGSDLSLKCGSLSHKLFNLLVSDSFHPQRITRIHEVLYPGEFFNPFSSKHRIEEQVRRLRVQLRPFELEIISIDGMFQLKSETNLSFDASQVEGISYDSIHLYRNRIVASLDRSAFCGRDIARLFKTSVRSAQRVIKEMRSKGYLSRNENDPKFYYRLGA